MTGGLASAGNMVMPGLGSVLGVGLGALGGYLDNLGTEEWNKEYVKRQKDWYKDMMNMSRTNAMGQTGEEAQLGAQRALASLMPSAEATQAGLRANQAAGRLLSTPQATMDLGSMTAKRTAGAQKASTMNLAREAGLGGSGIAELTRSLADSTANTLGQMTNQVGSQAQGAIAQAGELYTKAPQILNQDMQTRFNTYVSPYLVQHTPFKAEVDQIKENPYSGLASALGNVGNTQIGSDYGSQMDQTNQQGYLKNGVNSGKMDLFGSAGSMFGNGFA